MMSAAELPTVLVEAALHYASRGFEIFPASPSDKAPLVENGFKDATTDTDQIREWWARNPNALIAARIPPDQVVLDIDPRHGGDKSWTELQQAYASILAARVHRSGRGDGGAHYWFLRPAGKLSTKKLNDWAKRNNVGGPAGKNGWTAGVDILHHNFRYSILPPSPHPDTGKAYEWVTRGEPSEMPGFLADLLIADPPPQPTTIHRPTDADSIADWFTDHTSWNRILEPHGWTVVHGDGDTDGSKWKHPTATAASSASVRHGCLFVYSGNTDFPETEPDDPHGITRFRAWATLEHDGDMSNAARAAREQRDGPAPRGYTFNPDPPKATDPDAEWTQPEPLGVVDPPGFPVDALPEWVRPMVAGVASDLQAPIDLPAMLTIGALAIVFGGRAHVAVRSTWNEPLNLYTVTALDPSVGKSPAVKLMTGVLKEWVETETERTSLDIELAKQKRRMLESDMSKAEKAGDRNLAGSLLVELTKTTVPPKPQLWTDDATPEAFVKRLHDYGGRMSILSTEGGVFQLMAGRYSDQMANLDPYLKAWSGDTIVVDRIGRESFSIPTPATSIVLTVQPSVLAQVGANTDNRNRGLPARFMMSIPLSNVGNRDLIGAPTIDPDVKYMYDRQLGSLVVAAQSMTNVMLRLTDQARQQFLEWRQGLERRRRHDLAAITEWSSKLESSVVRLAGLFHLADEIHDDPITVETMERAIRVGEYWIEHAKVAHQIWDNDSSLAAARRVMAKLVDEQIKQTTVRDIHRAHRRLFADVEEAVAAVEELIDRGWIRPSDPIGKVRAARRGAPSPTLVVHPNAESLWKLLLADDPSYPQKQRYGEPHVAHVVMSPKDVFEPSSSSISTDTRGAGSVDMTTCGESAPPKNPGPNPFFPETDRKTPPDD